MNEPPNKRFWFHARRYGWGWGLPATWEGWVVMALYVGGMVAGGHWLVPARQHLAFMAWATLLSAALVATCWLKGPPPRWHWGNRD
jgi:hypothetical protein